MANFFMRRRAGSKRMNDRLENGLYRDPPGVWVGIAIAVERMKADSDACADPDT
jgi:hypothetical protein